MFKKSLSNFFQRWNVTRRHCSSTTTFPQIRYFAKLPVMVMRTAMMMMTMMTTMMMIDVRNVFAGVHHCWGIQRAFDFDGGTSSGDAPGSIPCSYSSNAQWAVWVVRKAFEWSLLPIALKFCFFIVISKSFKFRTSLERILIYSW